VHQITKGTERTPSLFFCPQGSVLEAVAERLPVVAPAVPDRPQAKVHGCHDHAGCEDRPEIARRCRRAPGAGLRSEVEEVRKHLRDCHRYLLPIL
jgi:hypothetical protein